MKLSSKFGIAAAVFAILGIINILVAIWSPHGDIQGRLAGTAVVVVVIAIILGVIGCCFADEGNYHVELRTQEQRALLVVILFTAIFVILGVVSAIFVDLALGAAIFIVVAFIWAVGLAAWWVSGGEF